MNIMKHPALAFYTLLLLVMTSCSQKLVIKQINTEPEKGEIPIRIAVKTGETWIHNQKMMAFNLKIIPQFVIWIEDTNGNYIDTLLVTKAFGKQAWKNVKVDPDTTLRNASLPVWTNRRKAAGYRSPTKNSPAADSITGATPDQDFIVNTKIPGNLNRFVIFLEINKSFDGNDAFFGAWDGTDAGFTEEVINGQPSVVWSALVDLKKPGKPLIFEPVGRGGISGEDGTLYSDQTGLTTALEMIEEARVDF